MEEVTVAAAESAREGTVAAAVPPKKKRHINQQKLQDNLWGWAFCVPLIVGTVLFVYTALVIALILSFGHYTTAQGSVWEYLSKMFSGQAKIDDPFYWYKWVFCENEWSSSIWAGSQGSHISWAFPEIGEQIGIDKSSVSRTIKRGERRLQRCLRYGAEAYLRSMDDL